MHNLICEACFHKPFMRSMRLSAWESIIYFDKSTISRKIYAGALVVWAELLGHPSWGGWVIKLAFLPAYAECRHGTLLCWKAVLEPEIASDRTMTGRLRIRTGSCQQDLLSSAASAAVSQSQPSARGLILPASLCKAKHAEARLAPSASPHRRAHPPRGPRVQAIRPASGRSSALGRTSRAADPARLSTSRSPAQRIAAEDIAGAARITWGPLLAPIIQSRNRSEREPLSSPPPPPHPPSLTRV